MGIEILKGTALVRAHPEMFIGPSEPDLIELAQLVTLDALVLGAQSVSVDRIDDWYVVSAEIDWITARTKFGVVESFNSVEPLPRQRANHVAARSNITVNAFAQEVLTCGPDGVHFIKGVAPSMESLAAALALRYSGKRVVAFRGLDRG
jgi:hypothetical protein